MSTSPRKVIQQKQGVVSKDKGSSTGGEGGHMKGKQSTNSSTSK